MRRLSRWQRFVLWCAGPRRWLRVRNGDCPWCGRRLLTARLTGGPAKHHIGTARYCTQYHYYESCCKFRTSIIDPVSNRSVPDLCRVQVCVQDAQGNIPQEAKQTIDSLIYALHRLVLYERFYASDMVDHREVALDAAIRSCETLMNKLLKS